MVGQSSTTALKQFKSEIFTASGSQIEVKGKASVMIEIDGIQCLTEMAVADIDIDAILGLDFIRGHGCQLDKNKDTLTIKDKTCKLNVDGKIGCYRITVSQNVEIPAMSEVIIEGKVHHPILQITSWASLSQLKKKISVTMEWLLRL